MGVENSRMSNIHDQDDASAADTRVHRVGVEQPSMQGGGQINLDKAKRLDVQSFPDAPQGRYQELPATIPNVQHLLNSYGITVRYNAIKKKLQITLPSNVGTSDNADNTAMTQIISLANLNGMPIGQIPAFVDLLGDRNVYNPVAQWIQGKSWDGVDRLPLVFDTLQVKKGFPESLKETLVRKWLLSAVAAALKPSGFRGRGVLTFQGPQGIGKTSWVASLIPSQTLREMVVKLDHHLDPSNKDSILGAISHWIVEIGELDSSFKKDVARLKGVLTSDCDKVRRPYARTESEYPRRTVFFATVNDNNFLVDSTGNTRWWTIPLVSIKYEHNIDMQQVYAQLAVDFEKGEQWWLTHGEETLLELQNREHRSISVVREKLLEVLELDRGFNSGDPAMAPLDVLRELGFENPTNPQCKECASILRELFGESKRVNGMNKWRIPLRVKPLVPLMVGPASDPNDGY